MLFNDTRLHLMTTIFSTFVGFNLAYRRNLFTNDQLVICEKKISWCTFKQAMLIMAMMSIADHWFCYSAVAIAMQKQGGRCCASTRAALTERSGSSTKGRTPNIRYFVAKLSIVAIYALFERLSQGFERKSSCFRRALNESHLAFVEHSTKAILLSTKTILHS